MASRFVDDCVRAMNVVRDRHQVSPLKHNPDITSTAQSWADHMASAGSLSHNSKASYRGENLGENCAMNWTSDRQDFTGQQVVDQWYSEVERYDFNANSGPKTGHFTQLVWKSSREVGIGRAQSRDGKWFVVANFFPAGNFIGHNAENVFPPRDGKIVLPAKNENRPAKAEIDQRETKPSELRDWFGDDVGGLQWGSSSSGGGESVKRQVQTETIGRGRDAVTKTTIIETRTTPDGRSTTTRTVKETRGTSHVSNDTMEQSSMYHQDDDDERTRDEFANDILRCHNVYRDKHGSAERLRLNDEMSSMAQEWAEHLALTGKLEHSNKRYRGQPVGENVTAKTGTGSVDYTGQEVVDKWYSEQAKFNYGKPEGAKGVGHFTQVVWKSSQELGVGKAKSLEGRQVFVVCLYFPAGNYVGRFKENVLHPK